MLPVLQLAGASIPVPPIILLIGLYVALDVAQRQAARRGVDGNKAYNLGFNTLVIGLLAARLAFVLINLDVYLAIRPVGRMLIAFVTPLLGSEIPLVGLAAGLLYAAFYIRRNQFKWARVADAYAVGAAVFLVSIWLAHFASGDSYGIQTTLPWGINLWNATRHPTQIYNLLISAGILYLLLRVEPVPIGVHKKKKKKSSRRNKKSGGMRFTPSYNGFAAQLFFMLTGLTIVILEPLRADSRVVLGNLRIWQIAGLLALLIGLAISAWQAPRRSTRTPPA